MSDDKFPRSAEEWRREAVRLAYENEALRQENERLKSTDADAKPAAEPFVPTFRQVETHPCGSDARQESDVRAQTRHWINRITEAAADNFKIPQELIDGLHQWMSGQSIESLPFMLREVERINAKLQEIGTHHPKESVEARLDALEKRTGRLYSRYTELQKLVGEMNIRVSFMWKNTTVGPREGEGKP